MFVHGERGVSPAVRNELSRLQPSQRARPAALWKLRLAATLGICFARTLVVTYGALSTQLTEPSSGFFSRGDFLNRRLPRFQRA
jgi:hypothetical protein